MSTEPGRSPQHSQTRSPKLNQRKEKAVALQDMTWHVTSGAKTVHTSLIFKLSFFFKLNFVVLPLLPSLCGFRDDGETYTYISLAAAPWSHASWDVVLAQICMHVAAELVCMLAGAYTPGGGAGLSAAVLSHVCRQW